MNGRSDLVLVVAMLLLSFAVCYQRALAQEVSENPVAENMAEAAAGLLDALSDDAKAQARFEFDNEKERKDWSNLPARVHPRNGLSFGEMTDGERRATHRLIETGLSTQGYAKAFGVMHLDDVWAGLVEARRRGGGAMFGADKYWIAVFGEPGLEKVWGWQLDGHHLAVNLTSVQGKLNAMPMFFGAEPEVVPSGPYAGWRIFSSERRKALALGESLTAEQRTKAVLSETIPAAIFTGPGDGDALKKFEGITADLLNLAQRELLWDLVNEYLDNAAPAIAEAHRERIRADGDETLYFAWMGPIDDEANFYYRVHGPSVIIEYDNTSVGPRSGGYTNHIHTVLREPSNDFGDDLLRKHYAESEHHRQN